MLFVFAGYLLIILLYIPDTNQVELFILLWIIRPISAECGFYRHIGEHAFLHNCHTLSPMLTGAVDNSVAQGQTAAAAHLKSKQLPLFAFAMTELIWPGGSVCKSDHIFWPNEVDPSRKQS